MWVSGEGENWLDMGDTKKGKASRSDNWVQGWGRVKGNPVSWLQ